MEPFGSTMHRHLSQSAWWLLITTLLLAGININAQSLREQTSNQSSAAVRNTLVDVGGFRLHFRITDGRSPAIVLESGGGADSSEWSALQPELNRRTGLAVVSYDRAGFGDSDLPSTSYNAIEEVAGLRKG